MEPTLPAPHHSPEMGPPMRGPELPVRKGGEFQPAVEHQENQESREQKPSGGDGSGPAIPPPLATPMPPLPNPMQAHQGVAAVADDTPLTAGDDDVIEKEWVEKAKKVIAETKHDPYSQEREVSKLQADYLYKRYGKTVKLPNEG